MLGVCYYPEQWDEARWTTDARRMRELGISFVRIGEFAWSRIEPARDQFNFGWLDRAMDVLHAAGLKIVLGTPTATPPKWLVDECPDILPYDEQGRVRGFGSRRHYTMSSQAWWRESARIVTAIAQRYGDHPGLVGWQTDNEYGCHDTTLSWGPEDLRAFQDWLRRRYQSCDQLNEAWGAVFWSMEVADFAEVTLPNLTVTEANPAHRMDFWRFHSDQVAAYDLMQCDIIRAHSPGRWITHNFMGFVSDFDHFAVADHLDLASWDSYPIGFVEKFPFSEAERNRWAETSHPDIAPWHHDLYRGVGRGRFWVMEQQPGPVNWAAWNPVPKPGMVRLWTWEAMAHGAEVVSYFRWRQAPFAQEQYHAGLNLPGADALSPGGLEAGRVAQEIAQLGQLPAVQQAPVAIVFDYASYWATMVQPQGCDFRYEELAFRWYEALRRRGLDVDVVRPGAPLGGYAAVIVPTMIHVTDAAQAALESAKGVVLIGPRAGSRTRSFAIPHDLPPGPLHDLTQNRVIEVASLRPGLTQTVSGGVEGHATRWRDHATTTAQVLARFEDGGPALTQHGQALHLLCWPDEALLGSVMDLVCHTAGLHTMPLPEHIRLRRRGDLWFFTNYGPEAWSLPESFECVLGNHQMPAQSVTVAKSLSEKV
ncbi:beta-galactosidase [Cypionkella aquatica]|uniref:Beta-galactosidase n=1 Tax=Cypionkella aquatica TaxID=1756042 RepID=A0AA37U0E4_9RHOB|nr:beta-galactosidase [Cypionkella aquatica]GLS88610.1 beta-galactosidase [Cypionkella aquatica]GLS88680.1 beta-galactosidase [Cypionkella aquatica]